MGECVRYGFTRIMPIYCLEFDLFEKSVWFGGKIEYCAICPYMAWVSGSSPDHPKKIFLGHGSKMFLGSCSYSTISFVWPKNEK